MEEWSRGMMIVTSALNIMNVPVGSIIGRIWPVGASDT